MTSAETSVEFWDARIEVSGIPQSSTRIPLIPDQTSFINQWYDWYRGYAISPNLDGSEERRALIGEALSEVSLGHLPRTTVELQARDTEQVNPQTSITQQNVSRPSIIAPSSHFFTTGSDIDPEDRIFDSSNNSASSEASDNSDNEGSPPDLQQRLLLLLQQNIEDIRANVVQLTRRIPQYRDSSQISTISRQLNSVTRSLGVVRRHRHTHSQQHPTGQAMGDHMSTGSNYQGERHLQGFDPSAHSLTTQSIRHLDDEELQQRISWMCGISEINSPGDGPFRPISPTLVRALQQAFREQDRRRRLAGNLGTRGEVERQGHNHQSPLTSLLARPAPGQSQHQTLVDIDREHRQLQATSENQGTSNPSTGLPRSVNHGTGIDALGISPGEAEALSRTLRQTYGHPEYPSRPLGSGSGSMEGLDRSDPSVFRSGLDSARQNTSSLTEGLRRYREHYGLEYAALGGQSARTSPALPSNNPNEPRIWRYGTSGASPEAHYRSDVHLFSIPRSVHTAARQGFAGSTLESRNTNTTTPESTTYGLSSPAFNPGGPDESRATNAPRPPYMPMTDPPMGFDGIFAGEALTPLYPHLGQDGDRIWSYSTTRTVQREPRRRQQRQPQPQASLDNDSTRPEPVSKEAMTVFMECKICFAQLSNQAVMPC
ncbi:MAG: hypothetical protein Q9224_005166, partial [Gallowayella concinna]